MKAVGPHILERRESPELDESRGIPNGIPMPTITTKLSKELANQVRRAAVIQKTTVSAFVRGAIEREMAGRPADTFGARFNHLFGTAKRLPANASRKEAYED